MRVLRRLAFWRRFSSHGADLMEEMAFHREMIERDLIQRGLSPEAAREQARRTMGNETLMREESRAVWLWPSLDAIRQDATYTLRDLRRNPIFTVGVIATLALGIGANAAMFSLVDRLLFRPPAFMIDPATVHRVYLYRTSRGVESETGGIYARYIDLAKWSSSFSRTAGVSLKTLAVGVGNDTQLRNVAVVSADFFGFFNAPPVIGRYFTASEDAPPNPAPVAVVSQTLWETRFGSRPDVLGATLQIDAVAYTIIGVAPDGFVGLWPYRPPVAFVPVATYAASRGHPDWATTYGTAFNLGIIARRKPGVTITAASADLTNALRRSYQAQTLPGMRRAVPLSELRPRVVAASVLAERGPDPSSASRAARWLSGVTLTVLLIACANVANLLLARTIRRRREIAVRIALGVSRARLFSQLLTEGIILAFLGGVAGLVIAIWGAGALRNMFLPGTENTSLMTDPRTLLFAGAIILGVGVLTGLAPLTQMRRTDLTSDLKSGARDGVHRRRGVRTALVLVQCALSVILLVGAGLFVQSLRNVRDVRLGFDADSVLVVSLNMRDVTLDSAATVALKFRLLESVQDVAGVSSASVQQSIPFAGMSSWPIFVTGIDSTPLLGQFHFNAVSADYFKTMGTRIVRGRAIAKTDINGAPRAVVVGESMANVLWPGQDPIGKCIRIGLVDTMPCRYVVGVAEDIHSQSIDVESKLYYYYLPAAQWQQYEGGLFARARADLVEPVRRRLQREMPGTSYVTIRPLGEIVDAQLRSWILGARVFTGFGVLALVLATVGLYSVIAYNVTQRHHEIGVRLALGASRSALVRLVVSEGIRFAVAGIVLGGIVAWSTARWIGPMLFRQSPRDLTVFTLVGVVLLGVAVVASLVPAWRAARVDPKTALQAG